MRSSNQIIPVEDPQKTCSLLLRAFENVLYFLFIFSKKSKR